MRVNINCKWHEFDALTLTYDAIASAAGHADASPSVTIFDQGKASRDLIKGESIALVDGMHISCDVTGSA